jgi:4-amino-4-deoxy-L-arabinose transferase
LVSARRLRRLRPLQRSPAALLLGLWFALPLAVFLLASSRLPLYLLPLFAPFALATGRGLALAWSEAPRARRKWGAALLILWCAVLLGLKVFAASYPIHRDARRRAAWIAAQGFVAGSELLVIETALNGLRLYGYPELQWVRARGEAYPLFSPLPTLDRVAPELAAQGRRVAAVVSSSLADQVERQLETAGFVCDARPPDLRLALLLCSPRRPVPLSPP